MSQIPSNIHICLHYIGLPQGLPHAHETSPHTYNGLPQCSFDQHTVTRYAPSGRTPKYAQAHQISATSNNRPVRIIGWHTPFLLVPQNTCATSRWTFLLLIDVPIQDRAQQLQIYDIFNLPVPHGDVSGQYKFGNKYIGVTNNEIQAVMITEQQYLTCIHVNRQFCKTDASF